MTHSHAIHSTISNQPKATKLSNLESQATAKNEVDQEGIKMTTTSKNIISIGWLYAMDNRINLTPIFNGAILPVFVNVSKEAFNATNGDKELMKELALKTLYGTGEEDN